MQLEEIDLAAVAARLRGVLGGGGIEGYVRGRTVLRNTAVALLGCSEPEAERIVDTMVGRDFLTFSGDPTRADGRGFWVIEAEPTRSSVAYGTTFAEKG